MTDDAFKIHRIPFIYVLVFVVATCVSCSCPRGNDKKNDNKLREKTTTFVFNSLSDSFRLDAGPGARLSGYTFRIKSGQCFPRLAVNGYTPAATLDELWDICGKKHRETRDILICLNDYFSSSLPFAEGKLVDDEFLRDPLPALLYYSYNQCDDRAYAFAGLAVTKVPGLAARFVTSPAHTMVELYDDDGRHFFDPQEGVYVLDPETKEVLGHEAENFLELCRKSFGRQKCALYENLGVGDPIAGNATQRIDFPKLETGDELFVSKTYEDDLLGGKAILARTIDEPGKTLEFRLPYPLIQCRIRPEKDAEATFGKDFGTFSLSGGQWTAFDPYSAIKKRYARQKNFTLNFLSGEPGKISFEFVMRHNPLIQPKLTSGDNEITLAPGDCSGDAMVELTLNVASFSIRQNLHKMHP